MQLGWRPGSRRASRACGGHGARRVRRDAVHAGLPLSVTAAAVTPSPPGKDSLVARARAGLPYGRPASPMLARSALGVRGGDLLRRPTEVTPAPPAMEPCGEMQLLGFVSCGNGWGSSPQTLAKEPSALWTLIRGDATWLEARLAEGEPGLRGSRRTEGAPRRGACRAPPIRHGTAVTPSPPGKGLGCARSGGAPLRSPRFAWRLCDPIWSREAATSYGGRRRLLRLLRPWDGYGDKLLVFPEVRGRQPRIWGSRGQCPLEACTTASRLAQRKGSKTPRRDPCKRGAPVARRASAQPARHPHARTAAAEGL